LLHAKAYVTYPDVVVFSQVGSSQAAGLVTVREDPLDQFTTLPQKPFTLRPLQTSPVGVYDKFSSELPVKRGDLRQVFGSSRSIC
jgi:hypothetical protein